MDTDESAALNAALATVLRQTKDMERVSFAMLAEQTGIGRATLVRLLGEVPDRDPEFRMSYLIKISRALNLDPADVLRDAQKKIAQQ